MSNSVQSKKDMTNYKTEPTESRSLQQRMTIAKISFHWILKKNVSTFGKSESNECTVILVVKHLVFFKCISHNVKSLLSTRISIKMVDKWLY